MIKLSPIAHLARKCTRMQLSVAIWCAKRLLFAPTAHQGPGFLGERTMSSDPSAPPLRWVVDAALVLAWITDHLRIQDRRPGGHSVAITPNKGQALACQAPPFSLRGGWLICVARTRRSRRGPPCRSGGCASGRAEPRRLRVVTPLGPAR